jgi:hypothetical protein
MNESAIPAKNLTRPILVEGATRGTYDTLTQPKTTRTNHIVESASPSSVIRNDTYEDLADSPFPSTNPPKPNSFLRGQIHYDKPVGSSDLGIPNSLFFSLAVRKQRVVVPHQEDGRSEALSTGFSDEFEAVFVGHVVTEGGLRRSRCFRRDQPPTPSPPSAHTNPHPNLQLQIQPRIRDPSGTHGISLLNSPSIRNRIAKRHPELDHVRPAPLHPEHRGHCGGAGGVACC